jgi:hypothetical protein
MTIREHILSANKQSVLVTKEIQKLPLTPEQKFDLIQEFCILINEVALATSHLNRGISTEVWGWMTNRDA